MKIFRRLVVSLAALTFYGSAFAQSYPAKPVRILVGSAPGAAVDLVARIVADKLSVRLGQQFEVANAPGDASTAADAFAAAGVADWSKVQPAPERPSGKVGVFHLVERRAGDGAFAWRSADRRQRCGHVAQGLRGVVVPGHVKRRHAEHGAQRLQLIAIGDDARLPVA